MIKQGVSINVILLFRHAENSMELGEVLWAAAREVESFFDLGERRVAFFRTFLSEFIPYTIRQSSSAFALPLRQSNMELFSPEHGQQLGIDTPEFNAEFSPSKSDWKRAEGKYTLTYETEKILHIVGELTGGDASGAIPLVVTDLLLVPPPNYRYIIWGGDANGVVVSIPPTDPTFWRIRESGRMAIIKHRVRTALLSSAGVLIGLQECDNERCFLFRNIDSVTRLDEMMILGPEHDLPALSQLGFDVTMSDPTKVQPVVENPQPAAREDFNA